MPSLYDVSVPIFIRYLGNLDHILAKAEAFVAEGKAEEAELLSARLPTRCVRRITPLPEPTLSA